MTYCVGVLTRDGIVFASDSRTHAGVDNFATFCKMTVFERAGDRVLVFLSSGNLAGTQAVIGVLKQGCEANDSTPSLWTAKTMFDVASVVSDAVRKVERRDAPHLSGGLVFNASFIFGGQIKAKRRGCSEPTPKETSLRPAATRSSCRPARPSTVSRSSIASSHRRPA